MAVDKHPRKLWIVCVLSLAVLPLWVSLGGHPLNGRTEARYAVIAQAMTRGDSGWLVPEFRGQPHLTKPPLAYWAAAGSMRVFGENTWALRAPVALAGSALVVGVFLFGQRIGGTRRGLLAAGLLGVQPVFVVMMRQPTTDPWLALGWFGVLGCGYALWAGWPGRWWGPGFWGAVAFGLMAKAHLVLLPVGVVLLWFALIGRWDLLRRLRVWGGLPLALVPLLAWVALVVKQHPDAVALWRHETFDRAAGGASGGDHVEPWWYFLPVYLVGLYPANMLVDLPRAGAAVRDALAKPTRRLHALCGSPNALWWLALGVPLLVFSLNAGKRMNYLLPLTPVIALLAAESLDHWLSRRRDPQAACAAAPLGPWAWLRSPAGLVTCGFIACLIAGPIVFLHAYNRAGLGWLAPLIPPAIWVLCAAWCWRHPGFRPFALGVGLTALVCGWCWGAALEDGITTPRSAQTMLADLDAKSSKRIGTVYTLGFEDAAFAFYASPNSMRLHPHTPGFDWGQTLADLSPDALIVVGTDRLDAFIADTGLPIGMDGGLEIWATWPKDAGPFGPEPGHFTVLRPRDPKP